MRKVEIYTDGACSGNPGPGGWAAILVYGAVEKEITGAQSDTTNNRMEMLAAIHALEALKSSCIVDLYTDSSYVRDGIMKWLPKWKAQAWKTAAKKPVKNSDLWQRLETAANRHQVTWHWIRGHSGHDMNERADTLARHACKNQAMG